MDLAVKPHFSDKLKQDLRKDFSQSALAGRTQLWTYLNIGLVVLILIVWILLAMPHKAPVARVNSSGATQAAAANTTTTNGQVLGAKTYTVQSGDTLYGVATKTGVSWQQLAEWNNIQPPYALSVGSQLKLSAQ
jgi:LysM repeat protein